MIKDFRFDGPLPNKVRMEIRDSNVISTDFWHGDANGQYAVIDGKLYRVEFNAISRSPMIGPNKKLLIDKADYMGMRLLTPEDILKELYPNEEIIDMSTTVKPTVLLVQKDKPEFRIVGPINEPSARRAMETVYGENVWYYCTGEAFIPYVIIDGVLRIQLNIQNTDVEHLPLLQQPEVIPFLKARGALPEDFAITPKRTLEQAIKELEEEFQVKLQVIDDEIQIGETLDFIGDQYRLILSDEPDKALVLNEKTHKIIPARFDVKNGSVKKSSIRAVLRAYV